MFNPRLSGERNLFYFRMSFVRTFTSFLLFFLGVILRLQLASGKQIQGSDVEMDFQSAKSMSWIQFRFRLQEQLIPSDFLVVTFPFQLHNLETATASVKMQSNIVKPIKLQVSWNRITDIFDYTTKSFPFQISSALEPAQVFVKPDQPSQYYIKFLYSNNQSVYSPTTDWHVIRFTLLDQEALKFQKPGETLIIKMKTVSSYSSNAIVYDENEILTLFSLSPDPPEQIQLQLRHVTISQSQKLD